MKRAQAYSDPSFLWLGFAVIRNLTSLELEGDIRHPNVKSSKVLPRSFSKAGVATMLASHFDMQAISAKLDNRLGCRACNQAALVRKTGVRVDFSYT